MRPLPDENHDLAPLQKPELAVVGWLGSSLGSRHPPSYSRICSTRDLVVINDEVRHSHWLFFRQRRSASLEQSAYDVLPGLDVRHLQRTNARGGSGGKINLNVWVLHQALHQALRPQNCPKFPTPNYESTYNITISVKRAGGGVGGERESHHHSRMSTKM